VPQGLAAFKNHLKNRPKNPNKNILSHPHPRYIHVFSDPSNTHVIMHTNEKLAGGKYYHIYNRGINSVNLFYKEDDYQHFLSLYVRYIHPIADTFAWVLMPNHFHVLVRIREDVVYKHAVTDVGMTPELFEQVKWETISAEGVVEPTRKKPDPSRHFSHLFNAYSKYLNVRTKRHGTLFERPFNRKEIDEIRYLKKAVLYIHQNPVRHGFCDQADEYPWSSYHTFVSGKETLLQRATALSWFGGLDELVCGHRGFR